MTIAKKAESNGSVFFVHQKEDSMDNQIQPQTDDTVLDEYPVPDPTISVVS